MRQTAGCEGGSNRAGFIYKSLPQGRQSWQTAPPFFNYLFIYFNKCLPFYISFFILFHFSFNFIILSCWHETTNLCSTVIRCSDLFGWRFILETSVTFCKIKNFYFVCLQISRMQFIRTLQQCHYWQHDAIPEPYRGCTGNPTSPGWKREPASSRGVLASCS